MLPQYLLPKTVAREAGIGAEIRPEANVIRLTLGITRIVARESLEVSISGSPDGEHWRPLAAFPRKSYCGTYQMVLDLTRHRDVRYVRAAWKMGRWMHDERTPLFEFYVRADDALLHEVGQVAADVF